MKTVFIVVCLEVLYDDEEDYHEIFDSVWDDELKAQEYAGNLWGGRVITSEIRS